MSDNFLDRAFSRYFVWDLKANPGIGEAYKQKISSAGWDTIDLAKECLRCMKMDEDNMMADINERGRDSFLESMKRFSINRNYAVELWKSLFKHCKRVIKELNEIQKQLIREKRDAVIWEEQFDLGIDRTNIVRDFPGFNNDGLMDLQTSNRTITINGLCVIYKNLFFINTNLDYEEANVLLRNWFIYEMTIGPHNVQQLLSENAQQLLPKIEKLFKETLDKIINNNTEYWDEMIARLPWNNHNAEAGN